MKKYVLKVIGAQLLLIIQNIGKNVYLEMKTKEML
jgi:hypothetical protein